MPCRVSCQQTLCSQLWQAGTMSSILVCSYYPPDQHIWLVSSQSPPPYQLSLAAGRTDIWLFPCCWPGYSYDVMMDCCLSFLAHKHPVPEPGLGLLHGNLGISFPSCPHLSSSTRQLGVLRLSVLQKLSGVGDHEPFRDAAKWECEFVLLSIQCNTAQTPGSPSHLWRSQPIFHSKPSTVDVGMLCARGGHRIHGRIACWQIHDLNLTGKSDLSTPELPTAVRCLSSSCPAALMDSMSFSELLNTLPRLLTGFSEIDEICVPPG